MHTHIRNTRRHGLIYLMGISFSTATLAKPPEAASQTFLVMRIFFFLSVVPSCGGMGCFVVE